MYRVWRFVAEYSALLILGALAGLVWANTDAASYHAFVEFPLLEGGPIGHLHIDAEGHAHRTLTVHYLINDVLMALFFAIAGKEVWEAVALRNGSLRGRKALTPLIATAGGMAGPAVVYLLGAALVGKFWALANGWAIPTATDIAFAVAVLAVISTHLPTALRTFLLTLAVVDDLLAITVIAVFYTDKIKVIPLLLALLPLATFALLVQKRIRSWWLLIPLAALTWIFVHESGVHATVAGVLLGFTVPVLRSERDGGDARGIGETAGVGPDGGPGLAEHFEHLMRPISAGVAVPVFAFFAAGVTLGGYDGLVTALSDPIALGVVAGLLIGKTFGVFGTTWALAAATRASLDSALRWIDVFGMSMLAGVGFTVSLLIGDLAYEYGSARNDIVKVAVLVGSLLAALLAAIVLRLRNRHYRSVWLMETRDRDHDGVPDVYESRPD